MRSRNTVCGLALLFAAATSQLAPAQSREYPQSVIKAALKVIPADLAPMFQEDLPEFLEAGVEPVEWWPRNVETRNRDDWHYVHIDIATSGASPEARREAARQFPRTREEAKRYCLERGDALAGQLPWSLIDQYEKLIETFRTGLESEIVRECGIMAHFASCAVSPYSVSRNGDGKSLGNLSTPESAIGSPEYAHRHPAARSLGELLRRSGARYSRSIDLSSADYSPVVDVSAAAFSAMEDAVSYVDGLLTADLECSRQMGLDKAGAIAPRADEFYQMLDQKVGPIVIERIRQGALLTANLIGGAWQAAGAPNLADIRTRGSEEEPVTGQKLKPKDIVGSKNSTVFHYADCRFAKNISPENIVRFKSSLEARKQGRRQCRECKPE